MSRHHARRTSRTVSRPGSGITSRLVGLAATLALLAFVIGTPVLLLAIAAVPSTSGLDWSALTAPDDGTLALTVITAVAWVAWLIFTVSVVLDLAARARRVRAPRLPGLALPQDAAGHLISLAALLFVAIPTVTLAPAPRAVAASITHPVADAAPAANQRGTNQLGRVPPETGLTPTPGYPANSSAESVATHIPREAVRPTVERAASPEQPTRPHTEPYTVKRGDSLWKIAQERLGDGTKYVELVDLNRGLLHGEPDFLLPGTILQVPATTQFDARTGDEGAAEETYIVQPGDTLSGIAESELGDADAYLVIFDSSDTIAQSDGTHLVDPDLIRPGWRLTMPGSGQAGSPTTPGVAAPSGAGDSPAPKHRHREQPVEQPANDPAAAPAVPPTRPEAKDPSLPLLEQAAPHAPAASSATAPDTGAPDADSSAGSPTATDPDVATGVGLRGWLLPGLTGAGAVLAAGLWATRGRQLRAKYRYRRPGHIVAPPPDELRDVEKTAHASGAVVAPRVDKLDRALRHLAAATAGTSGEPPRLVMVELDEHTIRLHLATPTSSSAESSAESSERLLPAPWARAGAAWECALTAVPDEDSNTVAPYPLLASLGQAPSGALVLLNLEELRTLAITGDHQRALALGRYLAAELSLNPWSTLVEIDTLGIGEDLVPIDPARFHHHPSGDIGFLDRLGTDLQAEDPDLEPDQYRAVVADLTDHTAAADVSGGVSGVVSSDVDEVRDLGRIITSYPGRAGVAVVSIGAEAEADSNAVVRLTDDGRLHLDHPALERRLDLTAAGLTCIEAQACAALVEVSRGLEDAPMPGSQDPDAATDAAGALTRRLTEPRPDDGPAGGRSLLPLDNQAYEQTGAITAEDLGQLAPLVSPEASEAADTTDPADPGLDADLARWESPVLLAPKLTLLGPVTARTLGDATKTAHRRKYQVELLTYLHLHPGGVTALEVSQAVGVTEDKARSDLSALRHWLGKDPVTGEQYLPNARQSHTSGVPATYAVHGILTDMDLFRRLRARGQARGAEGMSDLIAALRLVAGQPFSNLRTPGWTWLLEGDRLDEVMTCAVADVAHLVTTHALGIGAGELARFAAAKGYEANPDGEIAQLDLVAVLHAYGRHDEAEERLMQELNRRDDELGPLDPPPRTEAIIEQRGWDPSKRRSAG